MAKLKVTVREGAVNIPTMPKMSTGEYQSNLQNEFFLLDHHDVLRSGPGQYPLAVARQQLRALIAFLKSLEGKVGGNAA